MTQTIELPGGGSAEFNNEFIRVDDEKAKRNHWLVLFSSVIWIPISFLQVSNESFDFSNQMTWIWAGVFLLHLVAGAFMVFRTSWQEMVWLDDVKSAKVTTGYKYATLVLKLKNGKRRSVRAKYDYVKDFRAFITANFRK